MFLIQGPHEKRVSASWLPVDVQIHFFLDFYKKKATLFVPS